MRCLKLRHPETARDFMEIHAGVVTPALRPADAKAGAGGCEKKSASLLFDVLVAETREGDGYIYVVIEHQSTPDAHMAFRLMRYAIAAMQQHLDAGISIFRWWCRCCFYHGVDSPYPFSLCWLDEFANGSGRRLYAAAFPLVDITVVSG